MKLWAFCIALYMPFYLGCSSSEENNEGAGGQEICSNGLDDNGDGLIDCQDSTCGCSVENCTNNVDDDNDGLLDCDDPQCGVNILCTEDEICNNNIDDDRDGSTDCDDTFNCSSHPFCGGGTGEDCSNGIDDDGDGLEDCNDVGECSNDPSCTTNSTPGGLPGGSGIPGLPGGIPGLPGGLPIGFEMDCSNGIDDDGNGQTDCQDLLCMINPSCGGIGIPGGGGGTGEDCSIVGDEDGNGLKDCEDPACLLDTTCILGNLPGGGGIPGLPGGGGIPGLPGGGGIPGLPGGTPGGEDCTSIGDEDGNGLADCDDPVCLLDPSCIF